MSRPSRTLIIDDNIGDRDLLKNAIHEVGWNAELLEASNGRQAVEVLHRQNVKQEAPDLVLLDYVLVGETCLDVVPRIRSLSGYESIPIIVVSSAMPPEVNRQQIYSAGVLKILVKAYDYQSLLKVVMTLRRLLTNRGAISHGGSWISDADLVALGDS